VCSYSTAAGAWIRVSGKAILANELAVKRKSFKGKADFYCFNRPNAGAERTVTLTKTSWSAFSLYPFLPFFSVGSDSSTDDGQKQPQFNVQSS
jgi:hypothetical protein